MAAIVEIRFDTVRQAKEFMTWLDGIGEQQYFDYSKEQSDNPIEYFTYDYNHLIIHASAAKKVD